jgi:hypothetical protein
VGFEPKIPASERAKIVHALDRSATVTGYNDLFVIKNLFSHVWLQMTCIEKQMINELRTDFSAVMFAVYPV